MSCTPPMYSSAFEENLGGWGCCKESDNRGAAATNFTRGGCSGLSPKSPALQYWYPEYRWAPSSIVWESRATDSQSSPANTANKTATTVVYARRERKRLFICAISGSEWIPRAREELGQRLKGVAE